MKKQFKKCAAEIFAVIICIVIVSFTALIIMTKQKKDTQIVKEAVEKEAYLFSGKI